MSKKEYIQELEKYLYYFPSQEKKEAVAFVEEFFDEVYDEKEAVRKLGSPYEYAQNLKEQVKDIIPPEPCEDKDFYENKENDESFWKETARDHSASNKPLLWALVIITSPFWLMLLFVILMLAFAALMMLFSLFLLIVSVFITGAASVIVVGFKALTLLFTDFLGFVFDLGIVLMGVSISILSFKCLVWMIQRMIPALFEQTKKAWSISSYKIREYLS